MLARLAMFLQALPAAAKKLPPVKKDAWFYIDRVNDAVSHPDFDATIRNPWFLVCSGVFILVALLRGWKAMLILYLGAIGAWAIAAKVVMASKDGAESSGSAILIFSALVVGVSGIAIYMLLIRD